MLHDLRTEAGEIGDAVVVRAAGDVDLGTVGELEQRVHDVLGRNPVPNPIVLDLSDVQFLGTVGLSLLDTCERRCRKLGSELWAVAPSRAVRRPLVVAGLHERMRLVSEDEMRELAGATGTAG